jgi:predicted metalloprotease with PDZ domain
MMDSRRMMLFGTLCTLLFAAGPAAAQDTTVYHISFPNRQHNEAQVTVEYRNLPPRPLELRMSRSSPGRYALHEFAKNVYNVIATNGAGDTLEITRPNVHQWNVAGHDGTVRVSYTLFADRSDGTYAAVDNTHAHLNIPATFMWARNTASRPIRVTFDIPEGSGWRIATQLVPTSDPTTFTARDLAYFLDSPTELSNHTVLEHEVVQDGRTQTLRIAMHHLGTEEEARAYAEQTWAIAAEQAAVFGEYPRFDYDEYTFIACYLPWAAGDGMEHRNSTILTSSSSLASNVIGLLGTVSHEFFHAWNMERLRSAALEPFDFEEANMSGELWFGEGFTSYYDDLTMRRAGILDDEQYLRGLSGTIDAVVNGRGRRFFSPVEMSMQAPFVDAAVSIDPNNRGNTFISYYTWGAALGLALDLELRTRFDDLTLDDYMRELWQRHGRPFDTYTIDDLRNALADITGNRRFANEFFDRYIEGREAPDFARLLQAAGAEVRRARPGVSWLGPARLEDAPGGGVLVASRTRIDTPLYDAGVDQGSVLRSLGEAAVSTADQLRQLVESMPPGTRTTITYEHRGEVMTRPITLEEDETLVVVPVENPTAEALAFREAWLGSRAAVLR